MPPHSARRFGTRWGCAMQINDSKKAAWGAFWSIVTEGAARHGGSVVSGIRSQARNESVGGHVRSRHLYGFAADVSFLPDPKGDAKDRCDAAFEWYYKNGLRGYKRRGSKSLHIQDRGGKPPKSRG